MKTKRKQLFTDKIPQGRPSRDGGSGDLEDEKKQKKLSMVVLQLLQTDDPHERCCKAPLCLSLSKGKVYVCSFLFWSEQHRSFATSAPTTVGLASLSLGQDSTAPVREPGGYHPHKRVPVTPHVTLGNL